MKTKTLMLLLTGIVTTAALPAMADDPSADAANDARTVASTQTNHAKLISENINDRNLPYENANGRDYDAARSLRTGELREANQILGMSIQDPQGNSEGKVKDLALDMQNGRIAEVIVERGNFTDEKLAAVPPSIFTWNIASNFLQSKVSKAQLDSLPDFQFANWNDATTDAKIRETYQRLNARVYYGEATRSWNGNSNSWNDNVTNRNQSTQPDQVSQGQVTNYYPLDKNGVAGQNGAMAYEQRNFPRSIGPITRASKVIGSSVKNDQDETLCSVKNLVIDLHAGRVVEVLVATGGFLGMGQNLTAVPPQAFQYNGERQYFTLNTTKDALKTAPKFSESDWKNATSQDRVMGVYSAYRVQPYFGQQPANYYNEANRENVRGAGGNNSNQDNTAQNVRDRNGNTISPVDQGNSSQDVNLTAQIRRTVMDNTNLSTDAHNVKIITVNGRVTLRGVVNSEEEKNIVMEDAVNAAGKGNVDDQLQVRGANTNTSSSDSTTGTVNK